MGKISRALHCICCLLVCDEFWNVLPIKGQSGSDGASCGVPARRPSVVKRIVGGEAAQPHSWPWQVSLATTTEGHFCGGTLISQQWVITAAHCLEGKSTTNVVVRLGVMGRGDSLGARRREVTVDSFYPHDGYEGGFDEDLQLYDSFLYDDIALVKLNQSVEYSDEISPVCLPPDEQWEPRRLSLLYATGWGKTSHPGGDMADVLQQVALPLISRRKCNRHNWYRGMVDTNQLCAGYPKGGMDTCQGDSGGPLVYNDNGSWTLVGVTGTGWSCARPKRPGVYAEVASYLQWISSTMTLLTH